MNLRHPVVIFAICLLGMLSVAPALQASMPDPTPRDYSRLLKYIEIDDLQNPLVLFNDEEGEFDDRLNRENRNYLNEHQDLLEKIQHKLAGKTLRWELAGSSKRLLVVPETRQDYADLFQSYCRDAVGYALDRTKLPNPYDSIATLKEPAFKPELTARFSPQLTMDHPGRRGVTAYLVHNIADEYIEEYVFFNQENDANKIKIKLSNRVFTGRVGSYTSKLVIADKNRYEFEHEPYTLWQNSAKNPINVFVVPVEETLHIALRTSTEKAIQGKLGQMTPQNLAEVEEVVDDWMAVEEAIVGGLVARLMPEIISRFLDGPMGRKISESLAERESFNQYRYLQRGIEIVNDLGLRPAVALYASDPQRFRQMISQPDQPAPSALQAKAL